MSAEAGASRATKTYRPAMSAGWWTRKRHYFLYMVREFTALPLALWLLWLLYEIYADRQLFTRQARLPSSSSA
jgi:fumarate reductase subunit C